jgi:hypothetical protein
LFLCILERPDGVFLVRYDGNGTEVGDTWHSSIRDAMDQASFEYPDEKISWKEIPEDAADEVSVCVSQLG